MKAGNLFPAVWLYYIKLPFKRWAYEIIDQLVLHFVKAGEGGGTLVFRLDLLGDYLMCRPFFAALRLHYGPCSFAGNRMLQGFAEELDGDVFDEFIWIDRNRFINSISYRFHMLASIRRKGFSVLIYPSHTRQFWLESLVRVSGAKEKITGSAVGKYMEPWEQDLSVSWYSRIVETGSRPLFEFYRNRLFFSSLAPEAAKVGSLLDSRFAKVTAENLILFAPGASTPERRWPETDFARLIAALSREFPSFRYGLIGSAGERDLCSRIGQNAGIHVHNYAGELTLAESIKLLASARLLVSNESGPVHMAATTGTACVCISNGNHFGRWNPWPRKEAPFIFTCYPGFFGDAGAGRKDLILQYHDHSSVPASEVAFETVLAAARELLGPDPAPLAENP